MLAFYFLIYSCIGYSETREGGKLECEPVYNDRFVLYKSGQQSGNQCWELGVVRVPVGCACAGPRTGN